MRINLPPRVRMAIYIITALSAPVVAYLSDQKHIGQAEVNLWAGLVAAVTAMAGLNVSEQAK